MDARQQTAERNHAAEFRLISCGAIQRVITILFAPLGVPTDCLQVSVTRRANPHIAPRRRNSQRSNPCQMFGIAKRPITGRDVTERLSATPPADANKGLESLMYLSPASAADSIGSVENIDYAQSNWRASGGPRRTIGRFRV